MPRAPKISRIVYPGDVFQRWTVVKLVPIINSRPRKALCRCECGLEKEVQVVHLMTGSSKSCGCHFDPTEPDMNLILSPEDFDLRMKRWHQNKAGYYTGHERVTRKHLSLHRTVLARKLGRELDRSEICDHINGKPWDNRRENLRVTDAYGNSQNIPPRKGASNGLRGACWCENMKKWRCCFRYRGKRYVFGHFDDMHEAAALAAQKRKEFGFLEREET